MMTLRDERGGDDTEVGVAIVTMIVSVIIAGTGEAAAATAMAARTEMRSSQGIDVEIRARFETEITATGDTAIAIVGKTLKEVVDDMETEAGNAADQGREIDEVVALGLIAGTKPSGFKNHNLSPTYDTPRNSYLRDTELSIHVECVSKIKSIPSTPCLKWKLACF
jgi:hypothetical protein